jgi:hypothetical protein
MSGETIPYQLRQNKHVDRQLFVELLSHANRVSPVKDALYISFGGVYFEDFKLIHQVFGNKRLLSIEKEEWVVQRQEHNKPYGCIECRHMDSLELANNIEKIRSEFGKRQMICWLDFAAASNRRGQLDEISLLAKNAREFDILRITMNVNPATLSGQIPGELIKVRDQRRLEKLRVDFADKVTREIGLTDVTKEGFALFGQEMIKHEIQRALSSSPRLYFQPMGSYTYSDSEHTMLTVTGTFLREEEVEDYMLRTRLRDFEFAGLAWELKHINVPLLSHREKLTLDQKFGSGRSLAEMVLSLKFRFDKKPDLSENMMKSYFRFHRYYPHFHRIQF